MEFSNIFISYAKEDYSYAENLYIFLQSKSYNPWLDKKKINAGQNWEFYIQEALRKADFIILLLSKKSVNKRGYVQREFKKALEYCEDKLDSDIYIIPLKIDDCEVPVNLEKFQWVAYDNNAFDQIVKSIEIQRSTLINSMKNMVISNKSIHITNLVKQGEYGDNSPKHIYEFHYPQFDSMEDESLGEINTIIQYELQQNLMNVRTNFFEHLLPNGNEYAFDSENPEDSTSYGKIVIIAINSNFVSFTSFVSEYYTGTPHGMFSTESHNYLMNPIRRFDLFDLFDDQANYLQIIRDIIHEKLMVIAENQESYCYDEISKSEREMTREEKRNSFYVYEEGLQPIKENFDNYYIKENSIVFIYNPYHITAWSDGDHFVRVSGDELIKSFPNETRLISFVEQNFI